MVTKSDLENVLAEHPDLFDNGFVYRRKYGQKQRSHTDKEVAEGRAYLLENLDQFERAHEWLYRVNRSEKLPKATSYTLKHIAERWAGAYVCNGALIAAALHHGFKMRKPRHDPNPRFYISKESIVNADEEASEIQNRRFTT